MPSHWTDLFFARWVHAASRALWDPVMLLLLTGTGVLLTLRTRFLPWRNLGYALRCALDRDARRDRGGGISPFAALMTTLAATIGTGNIVGVATALAAGGPGALVWMELSAAFGMASKLAECMLAVKYRTRSSTGEPAGGPMYVMRSALSPGLGRLLGFFFALFTALAAFGIGNITQSHSIAEVLFSAAAVPRAASGLVVALLTLLAVFGGIGSISRIASVLVPLMAAGYLAAGTLVILGNLSALPGAMAAMLQSAFSLPAAAGGCAGAASAGLFRAAHYGIARGIFSNEAGMGSAAITAAAAAADHPVRQGYLQMTAVFFDTMVICSVTGLAVCTSGVLDAAGSGGVPLSGAALTTAAFRSVLGPAGGGLVSACILLFAFSTILGWEYQGERAVEYLLGAAPVRLYRVLFSAAALWGAVQSLELVWDLSDLFNALMALPNLLCLLLLSGPTARELRRFQPEVLRQKRRP